jgi:hypothetical protein
VQAREELSDLQMLSPDVDTHLIRLLPEGDLLKLKAMWGNDNGPAEPDGENP